jgi:hypothetical protein
MPVVATDGLAAPIAPQPPTITAVVPELTLQGATFHLTCRL